MDKRYSTETENNAGIQPNLRQDNTIEITGETYVYTNSRRTKFLKHHRLYSTQTK